MLRNFALVLLALLWVNGLGAQPRIQLPQETHVTTEFYRHPYGDVVTLTGHLWNNDAKYDRKTEEYLAFARRELIRRGFAKINEESIPFGDAFFNGARRHQHVKDSRPHHCEITFEYWPGPQLEMSRETYARVQCRSVSSWGRDGLPRSQAAADYGRKVMEQFDRDLALAKEYQAKANADLKP